MTEDQDDPTGPGIRFDEDGLTVVDTSGRPTRIAAEDIVRISAQATGEAFQAAVGIEWKTRDYREFRIHFVAATHELFGLRVPLGRYPGFDFDWAEKLASSEDFSTSGEPSGKEITIYRAYPDPIV